jgi:hypothetical protein
MDVGDRFTGHDGKLYQIIGHYAMSYKTQEVDPETDKPRGETFSMIPPPGGETFKATRMLCASCTTNQDFDLVPEHKGPRPDYQCRECGWYQTSTEGGYSETLITWLHHDAKGVPDDVEVVAEYIWRNCQGEYGRIYSLAFAKVLLDVLKNLQEKAGITLPKSPEPGKV